MSDLFHEGVPEEYICRVTAVMCAARWHLFQILTKRADRLLDLSRSCLATSTHLDHLWWGVSVENRKHGLPRIGLLQEADVKNRFLSVEPLLEDLGELDLTGIGWVIVGGESGPGARPIDPDWVRSVRDQCAADQVPFFFKQWGGVQKKRTGRLLDGEIYDNSPALPAIAAPSLRDRESAIHELELKWNGQLSFVQLAEAH